MALNGNIFVYNKLTKLAAYYITFIMRMLITPISIKQQSVELCLEVLLNMRCANDRCS